jgi:hypothetical protein
MAIQLHGLLALFSTKLHISGFSFSLVNDDLGWPCRLPYMKVIGTRRKALHHKVQQPRETDLYHTTDPAQRDALAQQMFNQRALLAFR